MSITEIEDMNCIDADEHKNLFHNIINKNIITDTQKITELYLQIEQIKEIANKLSIELKTVLDNLKKD